MHAPYVERSSSVRPPQGRSARRAKSYICLVVLLLVPSPVGCRKSSTNSAKAPQPPAAASPAKAASERRVTPSASPASLDSSPAPKAARAGNVPVAISQQKLDAARTAELQQAWARLAGQEPPLESPTHGTARILLLAPSGPLIVDAELAIDGEPYDKPMQRLVRQVMRLADANRDGEPTWKELLENPRFRAGQYGNVAIEDGQEEQFLRMYDSGSDGIVSPQELPRVMTRNAGKAQPFYHRSSNYFFRNNRINSPLRKLVDADRDGRIAHQEAVAASSLLYGRDANEDEILQVEELSTPSPNGPLPLLARRLSSNPDAAVSLAGTPAWGDVLFAMQERYEGGYPLQPTAFQLPESLYGMLDADGDERITKAEAAALAKLPPHIRVRLNFGSVPYRDGAQPPLIDRVWLSPELLDAGASAHPFVNRVVLVLPTTKIEIFVNDAIGANIRARAAQDLTRLDRNRDGYLDYNELPEGEPLRESFEDFDQDGNAKLYPEEIEDAYRLQASAAAGQIRARTGFFSDALYSCLDVDHNGRLTPREIQGLPEQVRLFDANGDGMLSVSEIPQSMLIGFVRGDPQQDQTLFQLPRSAPAAGLDLPRWFRSMDRNRDNELTPSEFLGDVQQFEQLDMDRDGYITASEAKRPSASGS